MDKPLSAIFLFIPIIQVIGYLVGYELSNYLAHRWHMVYSRGVQWGISHYYYFLYYLALVLFQNVAAAIWQKQSLLVTLITSGFFTAIVWPTFSSLPYRTGTVLLLGLMTFWLHYFIFRKTVLSKNTTLR
jgi:hypothetical protein